MSRVSEAAARQINMLRMLRQSKGALYTIRHRISNFNSLFRRDDRIEAAFDTIFDRIAKLEADTWQNIATLSPIDEQARKAIADRTLLWFENDNHNITYLLGLYDIYPAATEEEFRKEVMDYFRENQRGEG